MRVSAGVSGLLLMVDETRCGDERSSRDHAASNRGRLLEPKGVHNVHASILKVSFSAATLVVIALGLYGTFDHSQPRQFAAHAAHLGVNFLKCEFEAVGQTVARAARCGVRD